MWLEQRRQLEFEVEKAKAVTEEAQEGMQEVAQDCQRSMEEIGKAVEDLQERHRQEIEELEDLCEEQQKRAQEAEKAAEEARVQSRVQTEKLSVGAAQEQGWTVGSVHVVAAAATGAAGTKQGRGRVQQDLERAAMELEDMRALCVEQQVFVRVCTVAEAQQQKQIRKIQE